MDKKLFIKTIENIKKQHEHDLKFSASMAKAFPGAFQANLLPDNKYILKAVTELLETLMGDTNGWIDYFMWELDFGRQFDNFTVRVNNEHVSLRTPSDLYDLLIR